MRLLSDERAQSIQIGAVLLFAILIVFLSIWQAFVVPNQNEEIEFNHNEEVKQQMTELRTTVNSMPEAASTRSATVDLGVRYPSRTIFRNPPPVAGTIRTLGTEDEGYAFTIENATATDTNLEQLWDRTNATYETGAIEYSPRYNEYREAPRTVYEHSVLYNRFDREETELPITGQSLLRGDRIDLVALNGSLSENRIDSTSVDFEPLSTGTRVVEVEPDGGPLVLELPTRLSESRWEDLLEDEPNVESDDNVTVDDSVFDDELGLLRIELRDDPVGDRDSYRLRLAKVGVGSGSQGTDAEYLTDITGNGATIQEEQRQTLELEVRDEFNNPLDGVEINGSAEGGTFVDSGSDQITRETDSQGQISVEYEGTTPGDNDINFSYTYAPDAGADHDTTTPKNLTMVVTVEEDQSSTGGGDQLPGPRPVNLTLASETVTQNGTLDITNASFDNQGNTTVNRGGTDVVDGEYYVVEGDVTDPSEGGDVLRGSLSEGDASSLTTTEDPGLTLNMTGTIDTVDPESLDPGNYTVFIRGQDARGIWTNESVDGHTGESFEVTEKKPADDIEPDLEGTGEVGESSGKYNFGLRNTGEQELTLVGIGINETSAGDATRVEGTGNNNNTLTWDGNQIVDSPIEFDNNTPAEAQRYDTNPQPVLEPAITTDFQFDKFVNENGNGANMGDESVNMTVWVTTPEGDESATTITLEP